MRVFRPGPVRANRAAARVAFVVPVVLALGVTPPAHADETYGKHRGDGTRYMVTLLATPQGGESAGIGVNNRGWVTGNWTQAGGEVMHATVWRDGRPTDLGTLGGPNSAVLWPVKSNRGIVVGVAETAEKDPNGELWSCSFFFPAATGHVCRGFVWQDGKMAALPTHGGTHGFVAGANSSGQVVGWAETAEADPTCNRPQVLGFRAALWDVRDDRVRELPPLAGDTTSAATAINDRGQVVGISGSCGDAVGSVSARHAVLWENGEPIDIGNLGGDSWNTPMAISNSGTVVGFGLDPAAGNLKGFIWTKKGGIAPLGTLAGDVSSQGLGVNNKGQVVGLSSGGHAGTRAFLWENGVLTDLNELVAGDFDGRLVYANDINDRGVITGQAIDPATGQLVAFVATPTRA
ncbi:MAG: hypothetical protein FWJ93_03195 [Micromonosporaceae bacterium]